MTFFCYNKGMKKITFILLFTILLFTRLFASPAAINFDNLSDKKKFNNLTLDFVNAYDSISYPDFEHADSKKEDLQAAKKLHNYLKKQKKANYDEKLLDLLALRCLYNYDWVTFTEVEKLFTQLEEDYPDKPEHHWIYGNFLASSSKTLEGKKQLEQYMEMKDYYISNFFIQDYAYCQLLCMMPLNAYYTITNGGTIPEDQIPNQQLLSIIKGRIKDSSSDQNYTSGEVWKISKTDDEWMYVYSTMLGFKFPCKGNWNLTLESFSETTPAFCILKPNDFNLNGNTVSISLLFMVYPESHYNEAIKDNMLQSMPVIGKENVTIAKQVFEKYSCEDLTKYQDIRKGARTYIYFGKITPDVYSGLRCECPVDFTKMEKGENASNPSYYATSPAQKRLEEPLYMIMLVDTCNALLEETDALLEELFSKAVFE